MRVLPARSLVLCCYLLFAAVTGLPPCAIIAAFGSDPTTSVTISFSSNTSAASFVTVSPAIGGATRFAAQGHDNSYANSAGVQLVYRATLTDMLPATTYDYVVTVGSESADVRTLTTLSDDPEDVPIVVFWGDLGRDGGGQAFPALEAEAQRTAARAPGAGSVAIQAGDFGYNLPDFKGARGAAFLDRFSNISSWLPTWCQIGNHELPKDAPLDMNASHYVNMLGAAMPGASNGSYYSADVGLNHLVFLSSEVIALGPYGGVTVAAQSAWLRADLAAVNRSRTPWVVAVLHRPFYCSNANSWCGPQAWQANAVRLELEPIFLAGGVDVVLAGHEHSVELTWPVKDGIATAFDYDAPKAPVHIIAGAAGCNEDEGECLNPMGEAAGTWSRARLAGDPVQYGYSRFWASNATHWHLEQVQVALPGGPQLWQESVDIFQPNHGPF